MTRSLLSRVPLTTPPAPNETIESYLSRLERLNHLNQHTLLHLVTAVPNPRRLSQNTIIKAVVPDRLATVSGYEQSTLEQALPECRRPSPLMDLFQRDPRPACPPCVRARAGDVRCRYPMHRFVCLKHKRWIGGRVNGPALIWEPEPADVSGLPDIITAQRRHHRLVRRHGLLATAQALRTSQTVWEFRKKYDAPNVTQYHRLRVLFPRREQISLDAPRYIASYYPEIVGLAAILCSPRWHATANDPDTCHKFLSIVGQRLERGGPINHPSKENPLLAWIQGPQPSPPIFRHQVH